MKTEIKTAVYDEELHIEVYRFEGVKQAFPNHFHEHYMMGLMEGGARQLSCKNREYLLGRGDLVLFHPGDNHACMPVGDGMLNFRGLNISRKTMLDLMEEVTGRRVLPEFSVNVFRDDEIGCCLRQLHETVLAGFGEFGREENLFLLISLLLRKIGRGAEEKPGLKDVTEKESALEKEGRPMPGGIGVYCSPEIRRVCVFMDERYAERVRLEDLCRCAGLSKSSLLRAFTREKGVTPYRYLENVRINKAKGLLEKGAPPVEAAVRTGFSDQSHFTNYFTSFTGLSPGMYREIFSEKAGGTEGKNRGE